MCRGVWVDRIEKRPPSKKGLHHLATTSMNTYPDRVTVQVLEMKLVYQTELTDLCLGQPAQIRQ